MKNIEPITSFVSIVIVFVILYSIYLYWHQLTYLEKSPFHPDKIYTQGKIDTIFAEILSLTEKTNDFGENGKEVKADQKYYLSRAQDNRYELDSYFQDKNNYQYYALYCFYDPHFSAWGKVNYGVCIFVEKDINEEVIKYKEVFRFSGYRNLVIVARDSFWKLINGKKLEKSKNRHSRIEINPEYVK